MELYLKQNEDAKRELITRFQRASMAEAKETYLKYRDISKVDYNDLYATCLCAFVSALKTYDGTPGFYSKWRTIASREMIEEVVKYSISFSSDLVYTEIVIGEDNDLDRFFAGNDDIVSDVSYASLYDQVVSILANPKYEFTNEEKEMFIYYIHDFSFAEIGRKFNIKYATARTKVLRIVERIKTILNNSKD